jgi:serine acetyltransferase
MITQLRFFLADYKRMAGNKRSRYLYIWMSRQVIAVWIYRFERGMFLTFGVGWRLIRIIFLPIINLFYAYGNAEINYKANIGPGLSLLHSSLGNVVSGRSIIGKNLTLTGGNVIGNRGIKENNKIIIGDNCTMGANAVILGPVTLGNNIKIGACACVVKDAEDNAILIGVPAKNNIKSV